MLLIWSTLASASDFSAAETLPHYLLVQDVDEAPPAGDPSAGQPERARDFLMEVNLRGRYMVVPDSILDIWYFNGSDDNGAHLERPSIRAYATGLEFCVRNDTQMGAFYFDYWGNLIEGGYWDDVEDPEDYLDGDWMEPSENFGVVNFGINYYYDMRLAKWFSIVVGAGLGGAYVIGDLEQWDSKGGEAAYKVHQDDPDAPPDDVYRIPSVVPVVDINAGVKFHINDRASIRLEGGLHNLLYGGGALGIVF